MGIGGGIGLLAAGAILYWAVDVDLPYVDDDALGAILLAAGAILLVVGVVLNAAQRSHGPVDAGSGLALFAAGAVLAWALDVDLPFIADEALGAILMIGGLVTIGASLYMHQQQSRTKSVVERRY